MKKVNLILQLLIQNLKNNFGENILQVYLFGSQANGTANDNSDFDILIVLKNNYDWKYKDKIYETCYQTELLEDVFFDINIISEFELNNSLRGKQPFILNAIKNGITV